MAVQPVTHELDLGGQDILSYGSWVVAAILILVAFLLGQRERGTPFYLLLIFASMAAAFAEPLYDEGLMLYFYSTEGMHHTFTAFGVPQPIWAYSGYAILYAAPAIYINRKIVNGTFTRNSLYLVAAFSFVESCAFEMIGINLGTYEYWGPHVLRIFDYPIVIGVLETSQIMCFAVASSLLRRHARSAWDELALFVIFPCTFYLGNFGAGAALIIGLHAQNTTEAIITVCTLASIVCALALIRLAAGFLPPAVAAEPVAERPELGRLGGVTAAQ